MQPTKIYRFVGSNCSLGNGEQLERYGQKVELTEAEALDYIVYGNAALVPDKEFASAGHTDAELSKYPTVQLQQGASPEFLAKRANVWRSLHAHREALAVAPINIDEVVRVASKLPNDPTALPLPLPSQAE